VRIASTQYSATMNVAMQDNSAQLESILTKMASGQRFSLPSEDPIASVRLSRLSREDAALTQYRSNISALQSRLSQNEAYLTGMSNDMLSARDLMVWAADGSNTSSDLAAMANSLQPIIDSLFYTANSKDAEGHYVFSGTASNTPTLTYNSAAAVGSRYTFTGNTSTQLVQVGNGVTQPANVTLPEMAALLNQLDGVLATLQTPNVNVNVPAVHAQISGTLDTLDATLNSITSKISDLGGEQNILSTLDTNHSNVSLSNQQTTLALGQLDYADAEVKLNGYTAAVQATQKAYAQVSKLSLFDVL
jgi:flagellar hook-associated protein 3 FlgL